MPCEKAHTTVVRKFSSYQAIVVKLQCSCVPSPQMLEHNGTKQSMRQGNHSDWVYNSYHNQKHDALNLNSRLKLGSAKCHSRPRAGSMQPCSLVSTAPPTRTTPAKTAKKLRAKAVSFAHRLNGERGASENGLKKLSSSPRESTHYLHGKHTSIPRPSMSKGGSEGSNSAEPHCNSTHKFWSRALGSPRLRKGVRGGVLVAR